MNFSVRTIDMTLSLATDGQVRGGDHPGADYALWTISGASNHT
jgi:hypothetical protein